MTSSLSGTVSEFDEHVGLGSVTDGAGETYLFHCTQIADGTRSIAVGARVTFVVVDRPKGPEAYEIVKSESGPATSPLS